MLPSRIYFLLIIIQTQKGHHNQVGNTKFVFLWMWICFVHQHKHFFISTFRVTMIINYWIDIHNYEIFSFLLEPLLRCFSYTDRLGSGDQGKRYD